MSEKHSPGPFTDSTDMLPKAVARSPWVAAATAFLLVAGALCPTISAEDDRSPRVTGQVLKKKQLKKKQLKEKQLGEEQLGEEQLGEEQPVSAAQVYAYDLATYALEKVVTDQKGRFLFDKLPAGLYKVIAHKQGFVPAVEMLLRRNPEARQFMELHLTEEEPIEDPEGDEGYWQTRARIPADVLHQIQQLGLRSATPESQMPSAGGDSFAARMGAQGGTTQLGEGSGNAQLTDATVEVRGAVGQTRMTLDGRYAEMAPTDHEALAPSSEVRSMALSLDRPDQSRISLVASSGELAEIQGDETVDVEMEHYRLSWSGPMAGGTSELSAQLIDETQFYNSIFYADLNLPDASRTLNFQGTYNRDLTANTSLTTGMSYRQREGFYHLGPEESTLSDQVVGFFGVADSQIQPRVMVEYGVYSTLRDGELSLMPHGGVVVRLGADWRARTSVAQRLDSQRDETGSADLDDSFGGFDGTDRYPGFERFNAASFDDQDTCRQSGETCYEVSFEREEQNEGSLSVGAIHREFAETLRLYFSDDFFNRLESVLVVPGDQLPELKFRMVRQISPRILAKLESNIAAGGGGIFYATDERPYENQVRYLVTSLDTRFQRTSTGVFLAFHHLEQALNPVASQNGTGAENNISEMEIQRLQLMLTQDLSALVGIAPNLAVRFNMELSRGATPYSVTDDDELQKKLMGGISLSF